jgi:hypothetical protein
MKRIFLLSFALMLTSIMGYSQALATTTNASTLTDIQNAKGNGTAYVGYGFVRTNTGGRGQANLNGLDMGTTYNFTNTAAAEFSTGVYIYSAPRVVSTVFLLGPRLNYKYAFVHALAGVTNIEYAGYNAYALAFAGGGGAQVAVSPHLSMRASVDYVPTVSSGIMQSNIRIGGGLVYVFGNVGPSKR